MCCKTFWKRILPFALTIIIATMLTNILQVRSSVNVKTSENPVIVKPLTFDLNTLTYQGVGSGVASCSGSHEGDKDKFNDEKETKLKDFSVNQSLSIISKPKSFYSDLARQNKVQGTVTLRVTFLASGNIGSISVINGLPDGLNEQAIAAALNIKFHPAMKNGQPFTVTKQVQYNFAIY